jgi:hypothetical protein
MGRWRRQPQLAPIEREQQRAVMEHWGWLRRPDTLLAAIPNAGALGQPGLTPGLADLVALGPDLPGGAHVGFIELKRHDRSVISDSQVSFAELCHSLRVPHSFAFGRDDAVRVLEAWGLTRRALV